MERRLIVILDNVRSHHNVGSIFRSADAFGIEEIILGGITPRPPHRDIHKTALGATESIDWNHSDSLSEPIERLKAEAFTIIAIEQSDESDVLPKSIDPQLRRIAVIVGNEVQGVSDEVLRLSDQIWEIPQVGMKKSLNVSVCAGLIMHHVMR